MIRDGGDLIEHSINANIQNTINKRVHLTHDHPGIRSAEQTCIKLVQLRNHPTLDTLRLTKLPPNSKQANGTATSCYVWQVGCPELVAR